MAPVPTRPHRPRASLLGGDFERVLSALAAFVNTSPQAAGAEQLGDLSQVKAFMDQWIVTEVATPTDLDLVELHRLRMRVRAVFTAEGLAARTELVNGLLAAASVQPHLVEHDTLGLHIHYFPPYASLPDHLNADYAMALALLLELGESERLRTCSAPDCVRVFVDFSRNHSRLYCDGQTCGNRLHAAAYRARQRA